jgi:hypothetical protein
VPHHERGFVKSGDFAVFDDPAAADHDPVRAMRAAKHERRERVSVAGKTQLVELEQREVGQLADADFADVGSSGARRGA